MTQSARVQLNAAAGKGGDKLRLHTFIIVELIGEDDRPIPGVAYEIELPGGKRLAGTLDDQGRVRIDGIPAGTCQVSFPELDRDAWLPVETTAKSEAA